MKMASLLSPFRSSFRYLNRQAHENPVILWSCVVGAVGPLMVVTVPPIRKSFGWKPAPQIPTSYPLPDRARRPVQGYEDE
ncbi:NADH-ubiquinone oxidoreductase kDa subunit [Pyrrhoderma noxium]|uniref:NADH-ubiquinone oxidoreductase kDa subunit n=1 Tax=Pyrrhoderma noxium TaxID=2282107 RepID=A0A286UHW6_9AGAM|nr:NADH-ubiquinone oxidoreductase kDa subunit [Pyrrhoderma noxium]